MRRVFCITTIFYVLVSGVAVAASGQVTSTKPTFDCSKAKSALALTLCTGPDGALADWHLSAASWAYAATLDDDVRKQFWKEQEAWFRSVAETCKLVLPVNASLRPCAVAAYESKARLTRSKLGADALAEVNLSPERRAEIQSRLIDLGFLAGDADGEFGPNTRAAIKRFQSSNGFQQASYLNGKQLEVLEAAPDGSRTGSVDARPVAQAAREQAKPRGPGEFTRYTSIPASCETARAQGRSNLFISVPLVRGAVPGPACEATTQCFQSLVSQAGAGIEYLRRNPTVLEALRKQIQIQLRDSHGDSILQRLVSNATSADRVNVLRCDYLWLTLENNWVALGTGLASQRRPFEVFATAGQSLLSTARADFTSTDAEYQALVAFIDRYPGIERLEAARASYRQAVDSDDLAAMLQARLAISEHMDRARARRQFLSGQSDAIAKLRSQLDQSSLDNASESTRTRMAEAKTELQKLQDQQRGDIEPRLAAVSSQVKSIIDESRLATERKSVLADIERARSVVESSSFKSRLNDATLNGVNELFALGGRLAQIDPASLAEPATAEDLKLARRRISDIGRYQREMKDLDETKASLEKLQEKIDAKGRLLLDTETSSRVDLVAKSIAAIENSKLSLPENVAAQYSNVKVELAALLAGIDVLLERSAQKRDAERQGRQYARESGTRWSLTEKMNPMTDRVDFTARSVQKNETGAIAEVEAKCLRPGVITFSSLLVNGDGKPTLTFPNYNPSDRALVGSRRINTDTASSAIFVSDQFSNKFVILVLVNKPSASAQAKPNVASDANVLAGILEFAAAINLAATNPQPVDNVWRVLAQIQTSEGDFVIKIPVFDETVRKVVESCR